MKLQKILNKRVDYVVQVFIKVEDTLVSKWELGTWIFHKTKSSFLRLVFSKSLPKDVAVATSWYFPFVCSIWTIGTWSTWWAMV